MAAVHKRAMPRAGEAGCRPRLSREGGKGLGAIGPGCHWCLAVLLTSLEHLPLGATLSLVLLVQSPGLVGISSFQSGPEGGGRPGCGLEMHTYSSWLALLLLSSTIWEKLTSPKQTAAFFPAIGTGPQKHPRL